MNSVLHLQTQLEKLWNLYNINKVIKNETLALKAYDVYKNETASIQDIENMINELEEYIK